MPIWSYVYLFLIFASNCYVVSHENPRSVIHYLGEFLSFLSCVVVFAISYQVITVSYPILLSSLALVYPFAWSVIAYRQHYSFFLKPASEFAKTVEFGGNRDT